MCRLSRGLRDAVNFSRGSTPAASDAEDESDDIIEEDCDGADAVNSAEVVEVGGEVATAVEGTVVGDCTSQIQLIP